MPVIASIDPILRRIYLSADTVGVDFEPIDVYREMRTLRATDESLRPFDPFVEAIGNEDIGGGKATPRFIVCKNGTRIVPFDTDQDLTVIGSIITDDGQSGKDCFDRSSLSASTVVNIDYIPPQVEIITVNTGSGVSPQDITDIAVAVWNYTTRILTSAGAGGATAQEVWEYATRELTSSTGIDAQDIADIADAVWDEALAEHTSVGSTGEKLNDSAATVDTGAIATAVWSNVSRTLTDAAGVTPQDIIDIVDAVWDEDITQHAIANSTGAKLADNTIDSGELDSIASAVWGSTTRTLTAIPNIQAGDINNIASAVWSETVRSITADVSIEVADLNSIISGVWSNVTRDLTAPVSVSTASEDSIVTKVWNATTRALTDDVSLVPADITSIVTNVWGNVSRTLTAAPALTNGDIGNIAGAVWEEPISDHILAGSAALELTNKLESIDYDLIASTVWTDNIRTLTSQLTLDTADILAISAAVWDEQLIDHLTLGSAGEAVDDAARSVNAGDIATEVWSAATRTLTNTLDPSASAIAAAVWGETSRTLTLAPELLASDITDIVNNVWANSARTLTSTPAPTATAIASQVWSSLNRTLTDTLDPTANEIRDAVWNAPSRSVTDNVPIATATINLVRDAVWSAATRDLTDPVIVDASSIAAISTDVWSETARTLTGDVNISSSSISDIQTSIWNASVRDLTVDVDISAAALTNIGTAVWSEASRTLTDSGLTVDESTMIRDLWQIGGLDPNNPVTNTQTQTTVDTINIQYTGNSATAVTATRQP